MAEFTFSVLIEGYPVTFKTDFPEDGDDDARADYIRAEALWLKANGFSPNLPKAPVAAPAAAGGTGSGNQGGGSRNWVCPVHGASKLRDGKYGKECSAYSGVQEDWSRDKVYIDADGNDRWYCAERPPKRA